MSHKRLYTLLLSGAILGVAIGVAVSRSDNLVNQWHETTMQAHLRLLASDAYLYRTQQVKRNPGGLMVQRDLYIGYRIPADLSTDQIGTYRIVDQPSADQITFVGTPRKSTLQSQSCTVDKDGETSFHSSQ